MSNVCLSVYRKGVHLAACIPNVQIASVAVCQVGTSQQYLSSLCLSAHLLGVYFVSSRFSCVCVGVPSPGCILVGILVCQLCVFGSGLVSVLVRCVYLSAYRLKVCLLARLSGVHLTVSAATDHPTPLPWCLGGESYCQRSCLSALCTWHVVVIASSYPYRCC